MIFSWGKRQKRRPDDMAQLHAAIVAAALEPAVYLEGEVEDSFEGRFESLTLHTWLVMRRLGALPPPGPERAQELVDRTFTGLDHTLRELGVADVVVPRTMKKLAGSFLGRIEAYEAAYAAGDPAQLRAALSRNVMGGRDAELLARFVESAIPGLNEMDIDEIFGDAPLFPSWSGL